MNYVKSLYEIRYLFIYKSLIKIAFIVLIVVSVFLLMGCRKQNNSSKNIVNLQKLSKLPQYKFSNIKSFKMVVAAIMSPVDNIESYKPLVKYLQNALDRHVILLQRRTYQGANYLLIKKNVDLAFICTGAYIYGHLRHKVAVVAVPEINGRITYNAYIIVHKPSRINSLKDLKGHVFAFTDPLSNTGYMFPTDFFRQKGINYKKFFRKVIFTYNHTDSILAVADNIANGASVDAVVYNYMRKISKKVREHTKILLESPPFPMPPVVMPLGINTSVVKKVQNVLLNMNKNNRGRMILKILGVQKFIKPPKGLYNSIYYTKK